MKKYTLIVNDSSIMPTEIWLEDRPLIGDHITNQRITSIVDRVAFNIDESNNYIIAKLHTDNRKKD